MRNHVRRTVVLVIGLGLLAGPSLAHASSDAVLLDCDDPAHGEQLTKTYTHDEYQGALDTMPDDMREYTGCYEVIHSAMVAQAAAAAKPRDRSGAGGKDGGGEGGGGSGGGSGSGSSGDPTGGSASGGAAGGDSSANGPGAPGTDPAVPPDPASPEAQAALAQAAHDGATARPIGTVRIAPGDPSSATRSLGAFPLPVQVLLGFGAVALMLWGVGAVRRVTA